MWVLVDFFFCVLFSFLHRFVFASTDPAPVLEASHSLEERLQQLQSSAPDSEALVREISGHWRKHLDCLEEKGQSKSFMSGSVPGAASAQTQHWEPQEQSCWVLGHIPALSETMAGVFIHTEPTEQGPADAAVTEETSKSSSPAFLMTPSSTSAPGAPGSPQQNHQDRAEDRRWEPETSYEHTGFMATTMFFFTLMWQLLLSDPVGFIFFSVCFNLIF